MKNSTLYVLITICISFFACQRIELTDPILNDDVSLVAQIDQEDATKTVLGESNNIFWSAEDQIVAFIRSSYGRKYQIKPSFAGKNYGDFSRVMTDDDDLYAGMELDHIVAYYPYSKSVECLKSDDGYALSVVLPSEQTYAPKSFGNGAFPMLAVSENNVITFKNVCGGMKLQLTGTIKVISIQVQGNNGELLSGAATINAYTDRSKPVITMAQDASTIVTLNCGEGVQLNETTPVDFIFSLPPVSFTEGFSVMITDEFGSVYTVETDEPNSVCRSGLLVMPSIEVGDEFLPEVDIPVVRIKVEDGKTIESKDVYQNVLVTIADQGGVVLKTSGRAKGRGNATWSYEKKPYKIKFDEKQEVLGFPSNKEWVLLAEYCDKSLMRTAYMCELARTVGHPYPINYQHVQLYLNDEYMGLYVLTDQVEKKANRVDIEDDGFLFENDNYYYQEPLYFQTSTKGYYYTFKHPDPEDGEIAEGDDSYSYISGFMDEFEAALYGDDFKDPEVGYRKYIDVEVFAKWFLVQELIANLEPNMYYVLPTRGARLQIGPAWDAEWSLGLAYKESETANWASLPTKPDRNQSIWTKWKYFGRLFEDEYFVDVVRAEWDTLKVKLPAYMNKMTMVAHSIREEQIANFDRWQILGKYVSVGLINYPTWEEEVDYVKNFFADRVELIDSSLNAGI